MIWLSFFVSSEEVRPISHVDCSIVALVASMTDGLKCLSMRFSIAFSGYCSIAFALFLEKTGRSISFSVYMMTILLSDRGISACGNVE